MSKLSYVELISPARRGGAVPSAILMPDEIPVHHKVYRTHDVFTGKFLEDVAAKVHESVAEDLKTIERCIRKKLGVKLTPQGIRHGKDIVMFKDIGHHAGDEEVSAFVGYDSSYISLEKPKLRRWLDQSSPHPMRPERLADFAIPGGKAPAWYAHGHLDHGLPLALYFRNFAIAFNNLGMERFYR